MPKKSFYKIFIPSYCHAGILLIYFIYLGFGGQYLEKWGNYELLFPLLTLPILTLIIQLYLYRKFRKEKNSNIAFIAGAIPFFLTGTIVGYGFWGMAHGDTVIGFLWDTTYAGIMAATLGGTLSVILDFIVTIFKKVTK